MNVEEIMTRDVISIDKDEELIHAIDFSHRWDNPSRGRILQPSPHEGVFRGHLSGGRVPVDGSHSRRCVPGQIRGT